MQASVALKCALDHPRKELPIYWMEITAMSMSRVAPRWQGKRNVSCPKWRLTVPSVVHVVHLVVILGGLRNFLVNGRIKGENVVRQCVHLAQLTVRAPKRNSNPNHLYQIALATRILLQESDEIAVPVEVAVAVETKRLMLFRNEKINVIPILSLLENDDLGKSIHHTIHHTRSKNFTSLVELSSEGDNRKKSKSPRSPRRTRSKNTSRSFSGSKFDDNLVWMTKLPATENTKRRNQKIHGLHDEPNPPVLNHRHYPRLLGGKNVGGLPRVNVSRGPRRR